MTTIAEMAARLVGAYAAKTVLTTDELLAELSNVYAALKDHEPGHVAEEVNEELIEEVRIEVIEEESEPAEWKKYFGENEIICMVCGKTGLKGLTKHLSTAHGMPPKVYKDRYGIPRNQSLSAKSCSQTRSAKK